MTKVGEGDDDDSARTAHAIMIIDDDGDGDGGNRRCRQARPRPSSIPANGGRRRPRAAGATTSSFSFRGPRPATLDEPPPAWRVVVAVGHRQHVLATGGGDGVGRWRATEEGRRRHREQHPTTTIAVAILIGQRTDAGWERRGGCGWVERWGSGTGSFKSSSSLRKLGRSLECSGVLCRYGRYVRYSTLLTMMMMMRANNRIVHSKYHHTIVVVVVCLASGCGGFL